MTMQVNSGEGKVRVPVVVQVQVYAGKYGPYTFNDVSDVEKLAGTISAVGGDRYVAHVYASRNIKDRIHTGCAAEYLGQNLLQTYSSFGKRVPLVEDNTVEGIRFNTALECLSFVQESLNAPTFMYEYPSVIEKAERACLEKMAAWKRAKDRLRAIESGQLEFAF